MLVRRVRRGAPGEIKKRLRQFKVATSEKPENHLYRSLLFHQRLLRSRGSYASNGISGRICGRDPGVDRLSFLDQTDSTEAGLPVRILLFFPIICVAAGVAWRLLRLLGLWVVR